LNPGPEERLAGPRNLGAKCAIVLALAALVAAVVACGGDKKPASSGSGSRTPTAQAGRSGTPATGPGTQVRPGLGDLTSYKCTLKLDGSGGPLAELEALFSPSGGSAGGQAVSLDAAVTYVKPDKSLLTMKLGSETFGQITIGRQQWSTLGGLTVGPNAVGPLTPADLSLCASFWDEGFAQGAGSFQCGGGRESINGQQTRKCSIDKSTFDQVRQFSGGILSDPEAGIRDLSRFQMELWVTEGTNSVPAGLPVRLRADMAGKDATNRDFSMKIEMDVTNLNDSGLSVSAPR